MADPAPTNPQVQLPGLGDANEPWALESTLTKVLQVLQRDFNQGTRQNRSVDTLNRNVDRLIRTMGSNGSDNNANQRRELSMSQQNKQALQDLQKSSRRSAAAQEEINRNNKLSKNSARDNLMAGGGGGGSFLGNIAKSMVTGTIKSVTGATKGVMDAKGDLSAAMSAAARSLPGVMATVAGAAVEMVTSTREEMAQIAKTGQTFSGNMTLFAQSAAAGAVSTKEAAAMLSENAETVSKIGGPSFLKLQRQVRSTTEQFGRFGLSVNDQAKLVGDFYQLQAMRGRTEQASNAKAAAEYTSRMAALAKLTGKSIEDLSKSQQSLTTDADVYSAVERISERFGKMAGENAQKLVDNVIPQFDEATQGTLKDLFTSFGKFGSINQSELGQALSRGNRQDLIPVLESALKSGDEGKLMGVLRSIGKEGMDTNSTLRRKTSDINIGYGDQQGVISAFGNFAKISDAQVSGVKNAQAQNEKESGAVGAGQINQYDQNQTVVQQKLGEAYTEMLARAQELIPGIQALTLAAADIAKRLAGSDALKAAIEQTTAAFVDLANNLPKLLDSLTVVDKFDDALATAINKLGDFGEALGRSLGASPGMGRIGALGAAALGGTALYHYGKNALLGGGRGAAGGAATRAGLGTAAKSAGMYYAAGWIGDKLGNVVSAGINKIAPETAQAIADWRDTSAIGKGTKYAADALAMIGIGKGAAPDRVVTHAKTTPKPHETTQKLLHTAPAAAKPAQAAQKDYQQIRLSDQKTYSDAQVNAIGGQSEQFKNMFDLRMKMEKIYFDYQINLAKIRNTYEMSLLTSKYNLHNANANKNQKAHSVSADSAFRSQVEQAKKVGQSMDQYNNKAAKMGALSQAGIIVQPMLGEDIQSQQLQEMKVTNQFLYNIWDQARGNRKFKPLVEIYQPGL